MSEEIAKTNRFKKFVKLAWLRIKWFPIQVLGLFVIFLIRIVLRIIIHSYDLVESRGRKGWYEKSKRSIDPLYDYRKISN